MTPEKILDHNRRCEHAKAKNPPGRWVNEPNRVNWQHAGLDCMLVRNPEMLNWCGYVGVKPSHPMFGKRYDDVDVTVHGGLTYADVCQGHVCHVEEPQAEPTYWLGFDCAHAYDLIPGMLNFRAKMHEEFAILEHGEIYRDVTYVIAETSQLADQLAAMTKRPQ